MVGKTTESSTGTSSIVSISFSKDCLLTVSKYRDGKCAFTRRRGQTLCRMKRHGTSSREGSDPLSREGSDPLSREGSDPLCEAAPVDAREAAAAAAAELVEPGATIGLGSGRAV